MKIIKEDNDKRKILEDVLCKYIIGSGSGKYGQSIITVIFEKGSDAYIWLTTDKTASLRNFEEGNRYDISCIQYNGQRYISNVKIQEKENGTISERIISALKGSREIGQSQLSYQGAFEFEDGSSPVIKEYDFGDLVIANDEDDIMFVAFYSYEDDDYCGLSLSNVQEAINVAKKANDIIESSISFYEASRSLKASLGFRTE